MDTELEWKEEAGANGPFWYAETPRWLYNVHFIEDENRFIASRHAQVDASFGSRRDIAGVEKLEGGADTLEEAIGIAAQWHRERYEDSRV